MPHFIIEHGNALGSEAELQKAMQTVANCVQDYNFMEAKNVKVRVLPFTHFLALDGRSSFIHITVRILEGRTDEMKTQISTSLRDAFVQAFEKVQSISIDIVDMNARCYKKTLK